MSGPSSSTSTRTMWLALGGYTVLFALKLGAYFVTHLGVMFAEAMHSTSDMLIAGFLLIAAYYSRRPADEEFRFGYGRAQNVAALVAATVFISFTSLETLREAVPKLFHPIETEPHNIGIAIAVLLVSIVVSAIPLLSVIRTKKLGAAEKAQVVECVNDEIALVFALGGTILVAEGFSLADPIASIMVALVIAYNAFNLWRENAANLMGASPEPEFYAEVETIAHDVKGVLATHNVMAERVGDQIHLGMHIVVKRGIPIEAADAIGDEVSRRMEQRFGDIYVVVHVDPDGAAPARDASPSTMADPTEA